MTTNKQHRQLGFSLIELMVAILLGLIVMAALVTLLSSTVKGNTETLRSARLNQDLSTVMEIMVQELRRAGYTGRLVTYDDTDKDINLPSANCVLYSYNRSEDAAIDDNEWLGFRLVNGAVEMRNACDNGTGTCDSDCNAGNWEGVTDPNVVSISALDFSTTGSKCYNLATSGYWVTTDVDPAPTTFPCLAEDGDDLDSYAVDMDTAPPSYRDADFSEVKPISGEGHRTVETRQLNIKLEGELVADTDVKKKLNAQVKIRNDMVRVHP